MSDHGDYMGDHDTVLKMGLHYRSVIRLPFLWRDTDDHARSGVLHLQASTIDFAPTLLRRARLHIPFGMQGQVIFVEEGAATPVPTEDPGIAVFGAADARSAITTLEHEGWRL